MVAPSLSIESGTSEPALPASRRTSPSSGSTASKRRRRRPPRRSRARPAARPRSGRSQARAPSPGRVRPPRWPPRPPRRARCSTGAAARSSGVRYDVAARHGEAVGLAHGRAADDLDRERQVGRHAPDDRELLAVLLAEVGAARSGDVEQLRHHRGDAGEVRRPRRAFHRLRQLVDGHRREHGRPAGTSPRRRMRGRCRRPSPRTWPRRGRSRAGTTSRSSLAPNCSGLTKTRHGRDVALGHRPRASARGGRRAGSPSSARDRPILRRGVRRRARHVSSAIVRSGLARGQPPARLRRASS